ncbi:MAG TPA: hypothetical protein VGO45_02720 [Bacteroidia bacterium]|jgi:hypothetical protein|nr:hypothetical protein [Bacteroidia bacterium]
MKSILLISLVLSLLVPDPATKPVTWKKLRTKDKVVRTVNQNIPERASLSQVNSILSTWNHDFLKAYGDSLIAFISPPANASFLITRKWMMRFHFRNDSLYNYTIREALTGP